VLSIGAHASHDIAFFDIKQRQLEFSVNVGHSIDFAVVSTVSKVVVCGGAESGVIAVVSLTHGSVDQTSRAEEYRGMTDLTVSADSIFIATPASGVVIQSVTHGVVTGNLCDPAGPSVPRRLLVNSYNERQLIVGYRHGLIHVFDVIAETVIRSMSGHSGRINSLHLLPSGQLISAGDDQCGIIWSVDQESGDDFAGVSEMWTGSDQQGRESGEEVHGDASEPMVNYSATCYTVDSTRRLLYAGLRCGTVQIWNLETGDIQAQC